MSDARADIILPLGVEGTFTYLVPEEFKGSVHPGIRVEVQFGPKKRYAGVVQKVYSASSMGEHKLKSILSVLDAHPIVDEKQLSFWSWMSNYYLCPIGAVMIAALPSGLKLSSMSIISPGEHIGDPTQHPDEDVILDALDHQSQLTIGDIQELLDRKAVLSVIHDMIERGLIISREQIKDGYSPKTVQVIELTEDWEGRLELAIAEVEDHDAQVNVLLAFATLSKRHAYVTQGQLLKYSSTSVSPLNSLIKKGILVKTISEISRLGEIGRLDEHQQLPVLSKEQQQAMATCREGMEKKMPVLLHGVTGSGKTLIYQYLIKEALERGEQVLYLLPEIGLTYHFMKRMKAAFGDAVTTYHSRQNPHARTEVFMRSREDVRLLIGPRSAVFLPMHHLGLIIVDESHDPSYKQQDPAPRYHGRDAAIVLAQLHGCPIIMGSATPSIESLWNAKSGKYMRAVLSKRVKDIVMPEIILHPMQRTSKGEQEHQISHLLRKKILETMEEGRQVLIFRNRRGYAPMLVCDSCGWIAECVHCDVSLTYHKYSNRMKCHYCGYNTEVYNACPSCGHRQLQMRGSGTQKIEEVLSLLVPDARIARMDADTARGKQALDKIFHQFQAGEIDILIGTQMIAKGLDFENVGLVGVLQADALLYFPDFRSEEKAHQLLTQVSGRAGRTHDGSQVVIQTYQPKHPVYQSLNWEGQLPYLSELLQQRKAYIYPPYVRIVEIHFAHTNQQRVHEASMLYAEHLKRQKDLQILGPVTPPVGRVRGRYLRQCIVKIRKTDAARKTFMALHEAASDELRKEAWSRSVRLSINVDPY